MKTKLTYFGHACFMLTRGDVSMIFDPFLTGNTWDIAKKKTSNANISLSVMVMMITMETQILLPKQMMHSLSPLLRWRVKRQLPVVVHTPCI